MYKAEDTHKVATVLRLKREEPTRSLRTLGRMTGLSGEWCRQILMAHCVETAIEINHRYYRCVYCSKVYRYGRAPQVYSRWFCGEECRYLWHYIPIVCDGCGTMFRAIPSGRIGLNGKSPASRVFCSRPCRSSFFRKREG